LTIARQGSLEIGGQLVHCAENDGADPDNPRYPPGHVAIGHVHATYQYPADQRYAYPVLLHPGGGHSARVYDTTPDGREGWLTLLLRAGFATYGVDRVNSGRSGAEIGAINAVRLGRAPASALPALNRYSAESAWVAFRWGPRYGEAYPDTQFPIAAADRYYRQTIATYRDPAETEKNVAAEVALLDEVGPATLLVWSSAAPLGFLTAAARPAAVKGIVAIEPAAWGYAMVPEGALAALATVPILIVMGDRVTRETAAARAFAQRLAAHGGSVTVDALPEAGITGNGHTLMLERNNREILARIVAWLRRTIYGDAP
jgi:pimeloyl-ACP methyl ester carboxylesterase